MNDIVGYQLQRAAASGSTTLGQQRIEITGLVKSLIDSLQKVYADKQLVCALQSPQPLYYRAEKGDLMEIFGNLLDNAFKWSRHRIEVVLEANYSPALKKSGLRFIIDDDGHGISADDAQRVMQRGQRADEKIVGHGIGLSVVCELVELAQGTISIGSSELGGAKISIELPPR
ncbi:MAG: hypothetical protein HKN70_04605 [Gammaproteobacteria bacterium]|nr:hypothetical protein [Gammaproteobacteria bacterium]